MTNEMIARRERVEVLGKYLADLAANELVVKFKFRFEEDQNKKPILVIIPICKEHRFEL